MWNFFNKFLNDNNKLSLIYNDTKQPLISTFNKYRVDTILTTNNNGTDATFSNLITLKPLNLMLLTFDIS